MESMMAKKPKLNEENGHGAPGKRVAAMDALDVLPDNGERFLIFGKTGWIGGMLGELLTKYKRNFQFASARLENREALVREIEAFKPTHVLNAAGVTGRPNVDWCEDNKEATLRANVIGTLNLADVCDMRGIHCTVFATGCIFHYDEDHPIGGKKFTEEDKANFSGSFYSYTKGMVEEMLKVYKNVLVLRVRMPISDDLSQRNFLTKISKYERVVNIPNSMTVLTDLLPVSIVMAQRNLHGIYNFTNPGAISHNECLDLYKEYIDNDYTYQNFTVEEQAKILKAGRSNNELSSEKIEADLPDIEIPHIKASMVDVYKRMAENLKKENNFPPKRTDIIRSNK